MIMDFKSRAASNVWKIGAADSAVLGTKEKGRGP